MEITLSYTPLRLRGGQMSENDFDLYIAQPKWGSFAGKIAIEPLEQSMKEKDKDGFKLGNITVTRKMRSKSSTSWQGVYNSLQEFLGIRAVDGRQFNMDGLKKIDGLGYCILTSDLKKKISEIVTVKTSKSEYPQLYWPKVKKGEEFPTDIVLPDVDYRKITPQNAAIVLKAKRFCSGLEKGVVTAFKDANQKWFEDETGYNEDNLPVKDDSPVKRLRMLARNKPVFVQLVREDVLEYQQVIDRVLTEMADLEAGNPINGYKVSREGKNTYVNIKNLRDRLEFDRLEKDDLVKVKGRYEIVP